LGATYRYEFSIGDPRTVGGATVVVNGRTINFMSTHLDWVYESNRITQAGELVSYASGFAEDRIITGDLNGTPGTTEINTVASAAVANPIRLAAFRLFMMRPHVVD